jgi:hypothetical protein
LRRLKGALKMAFRGKYSLTAARQCSVTSVFATLAYCNAASIGNSRSKMPARNEALLPQSLRAFPGGAPPGVGANPRAHHRHLRRGPGSVPYGPKKRAHLDLIGVPLRSRTSFRGLKASRPAVQSAAARSSVVLRSSVFSGTSAHAQLPHRLGTAELLRNTLSTR